MQMRKIALAALALSMAATSGQAIAWGEQGHKTVAAIAANLLKGTPAEAHVAALLPPGTSLVSVSVWADCVKHPDSGYCAADSKEHAKDWTQFGKQAGSAAGSYHFADIDPAKTYIFSLGGEEDVVHGIAESIAVLRKDTSFPNPSHLTETQALWLLVHLVGDIHQPLHVGAIPVNGDVKATLGGNWLYPHPGECLHSDWDDRYVADAKSAIGLSANSDPDAYAQALLSKFAGLQIAPPPSDPVGPPVVWANDTLAVARNVAFKGVTVGSASAGTCGYGPQPKGWVAVMPASYDATAAGQVDVQLWKAGQRLAAILNAIWGSN